MSSRPATPSMDHAAPDTESPIQRALTFLASAQRADGAFDSQCGRSIMLDGECHNDPSIYPVALIAQCLSWSPAAEEICARAAAYLWSERQPRQLWSHWSRAHSLSARLAPDADDTAAASDVVLRHLARDPRNVSLLLENRSRHGLFYTWFAPRLPRSLAYASVTARQLLHPLLLYYTFRRCPPRRNDVDAVVNANVLFYLGRSTQTEPVVGWLLKLLDENAEMDSDKWYDRPHLVWYFLSRALRAAGADASEPLLTRLRLRPGTTTLENILTASIRLDWGEQPSGAAIDAIIRSQQPNGSWSREGVYHGGRSRSAGGSFRARPADVQWWGSDALTTAFAVEALSRMTATASR